MSGLEDVKEDRKVEVLQVDNPTANTSEALFPKCESEVSRSDIETAVTADSHSEPLIYTHESFDNIVVGFNKDFHGISYVKVNILKLVRLVLISTSFVLLLSLELSLMFNMIDILYEFSEESIFFKIAEISTQFYIYIWIALFILLSGISIYFVKKSIHSNFEERFLQGKTYLGNLRNEESNKNNKKDIDESKRIWLHNIFLNKELDSEISRFESNYDSKYKERGELITISKIFKVIIPIALTLVANYLINNNLNMDSKSIFLIVSLILLGIVFIIFIGFIFNFYREFIEELIEIFTPKNQVTELRYKRFISALRKANLIKVYKD